MVVSLTYRDWLLLKFLLTLLVVDVAPKEAHILSEKRPTMEPQTFIFWGYNPYIGGLKPSFFMVLGSKGRPVFKIFVAPWNGGEIQSWPYLYRGTGLPPTSSDIHRETYQDRNKYIYIYMYSIHRYIYIYTWMYILLIGWLCIYTFPKL